MIGIGTVHCIKLLYNKTWRFHLLKLSKNGIGDEAFIGILRHFGLITRFFLNLPILTLIRNTFYIIARFILKNAYTY